ncbi:MAG TPA: zf-HC2 domain-containing protein [Polyangiaceae bacterium]|nr:zf-HC2 domain-containing protein [Polyangiaceae bacterium]
MKSSGNACPKLHAPWETFIDGELPAPQMLELQTHLDLCAECSGEVALSRAIRDSTRRVVLGGDTAEVSEEFQARLRDALAREAQVEREAQRAQHLRRLARQWLPRAGALAISSAAVAVLWMRMNDNVEPTTDVSGRASANDGSAKEAAASKAQSLALSPEEALDRLIDWHSAPPEPQVTRQELVPQLERDVGVRLPVVNLARYGALWQGGSVVRVRDDRPAAYFRYRTTDNHRVTLYVYNPARIPLHASMEPRIVREQPVYEGYRRGYTIVAQLRRGVGYAVTTDLDEPMSAELVQAISNGGVTH